MVVAGQDVLEAQPQDAPEAFEPGDLGDRLVAGEISSTSVENFMRYSVTMKNMKPTPTVGML